MLTDVNRGPYYFSPFLIAHLTKTIKSYAEIHV